MMNDLPQPTPEYHRDALADLIERAQFADAVAQALDDRTHYPKFREDGYLWRRWGREQYRALKEADER